MNEPRIVAIGGGTGLPILLQGLKKHTCKLTAIVSVTDTGRSSGRLRENMGILPPGDIRNCLIALSGSEKLLHDIFQYRFMNGELKGHTLGNLFITAMTKVTGSFEEAIKETSRVLAIKGKVLPPTLQDVHICAELEDGTIVEKELRVRAPGKSRIKRVFLSCPAEPLNEALSEIEDADLVVLGPGSLYTSIITNLLISRMADTIKNSRAKKVYICNIMTQPGQTDNYTALDHVNEIIHYLGSAPDFVVINDKLPSDDILKRYAKENAFPVICDQNQISNIEKLGSKVITAPIVEQIRERKILWEKQDLLRHDSDNLANVVINLLR